MTVDDGSSLPPGDFPFCSNARANTAFTRMLIPSAFRRYISAASGKQYADAFPAAFARSNSSCSKGKIGISTFSPVLDVFTEMNPSFRSTSDHFRQQQSPRRIAVHMPVMITGRMKSSSAQASWIAFNSSGVNGTRLTVSAAFVTNSRNGL